jgi:hypothetical protein
VHTRAAALRVRRSPYNTHARARCTTPYTYYTCTWLTVHSFPVFSNNNNAWLLFFFLFSVHFFLPSRLRAIPVAVRPSHPSPKHYTYPSTNHRCTLNCSSIVISRTTCSLTVQQAPAPCRCETNSRPNETLLTHRCDVPKTVERLANILKFQILTFLLHTEMPKLPISGKNHLHVFLTKPGAKSVDH